MANRTYLSCIDAPTKYQHLDAENVECAASYMIPVFWYMLFNQGDLVRTSTPCDGDEPDFEYSRLNTKKSDGVSLAKSRIEGLQEAFGNDVAEPFEVFISFIESLNGKQIVVETCELVMMDEKPSKFENEANQCISAFSEPLLIKKGFLIKKMQVNPNWVVLFAQADISSFDQMPEIERLCGYSWERSVPWE